MTEIYELIDKAVSFLLDMDEMEILILISSLLAFSYLVIYDIHSRLGNFASILIWAILLMLATQYYFNLLVDE